jgi:hypothetical protein
MNLQASVIVNETQFPEPVHKKAHSRTSRAHHFGQRFLIDLGEYGFRNALLAEVSE